MNNKLYKRILFNFLNYRMLCLLFFISTLSFAEEENLNLPPKPTFLKAVKLAKYQTFSLKNGLKIYFMEDHKLPTVSYFLYLDYFPTLEKNKSGLGEITTRLMKQGAGKRDKAKIDEELDFMGTDFSIEDNLIYASSLKKYASQSLEIFSDIIKSPKFEESELAKVKEEMLSEIQSEKQNPNSLLSNVAKSILYPNSHPYSEIPTEKTVEKITIKDCSSYHKIYFKPNIAHLAITGDITLDDAKLLVEAHFSNWQPGEVPQFKSPKLLSQRKTRIYLMDRPDSVQSVIRVTNNINLKSGDNDLYSAVVMNTLLGGGTFRLYQNLREKNGFTYGVYSSLRPDRWIGNFSIDLSTESSLTQKSIQAILFELNRIRNEKVSSEELQLVKNYLTGQFSLSLENPSTIALFGIKTSLYKLPEDYFEKYLERIQKVSKEDVLLAANKYISPEKTNIIIVGKKKELKKGLKVFKKFKIVEISK